MSLTRRSFSLAALSGLGALAVPKVSRAAKAEPRYLLVVFVRGAWDVTWCLDPKPQSAKCDAAPGELTSFASGHKILTHKDRPGVQAFFAAHAARAAVINGIWMGSIAHASARIRILTGTRSERSPDVAALFAAEAARADPTLALPYVDLGGGGYAGPFADLLGRVGTTNQLVTLLDRAKAFKSGEHAVFDPSADERAALTAYVTRRADAELAATTGPSKARVDGYQASLARADTLRSNPALRGLTVGRATTLAQQGELAIALLRGGVARAAFLDSRLDWDTHDDIAEQGTNHESLFAQLLQISARLEETGLLARTTVAVLSEFTRTPKLNKQPEPGKDHWPLTSALIFGGNVRAGRYGKTDDGLGAVPVRLDDGTASDTGQLLKFDNFAAGLLTHLGVSHTPWIPNVEPFRGPFA